MDKVSPSAIKLKSGKYFDFLDPDPDAISVSDIAHSLSLQCRFNGHVDTFYSVAQHSVLVSHFVKPENAFIGLMHDATEAYIGDMASPLKKLIPEFRRYEDNLWEIIAEKYNMPSEMPHDVKHVDMRACMTEAFYLMDGAGEDWNWEGIERLPIPRFASLSPNAASQLFLGRFNELVDGEAA